jgi:hypothetical protein
MIGVIEVREPFPGFRGRKAPAIDLGAVAYDAGDDSQPRLHARSGRIVAHAQRRIEHRDIEFAGCAIDVQIGAREPGREQRRAAFDDAHEQLVHERVFRTPEADGTETARRHETRGIKPARMGRSEHERRRAARGLEHAERFGTEAHERGVARIQGRLFDRGFGVVRLAHEASGPPTKPDDQARGSKVRPLTGIYGLAVIGLSRGGEDHGAYPVGGRR